MNGRRIAACCCAGVIVLAGACSPDSPAPEPTEQPRPAPAPPPPPEPPAVGTYGVSAGDPAAVEVGTSVLGAGGNAVDAAVAAAFAVAVAEPATSGLGGGGAAIVVEPEAEPVAYDYREVVAQDGRIPSSNTGIPGFVAGMAELHGNHGALDFNEVVAPAVTLAREGTATSDTVAALLRGSAYRLPTGQLPHLYPDGNALDTGDSMVQPELADTLAQIADDGPDAFYRGDLADALAAAVDGIDSTSLAAYEVQRSAPPSGEFAGFEVVGAAPPLPGVGLIQMLQVAEALGIADHEPDSADFIHIIEMSWRLADRSIAQHLGDPDFTDVPAGELTDPARNAELAGEVSMDGLSFTGAPPGDRSGNTTHISVVDAEGGAVSMTNTLTNFWGSGEFALGFFLNDQLRRFSIGDGAANEPEAGRRSVSWSLPALVRDDDGRPVLVLGSPGGRRIPNILAQVLMRWAVHGQPLAEAVQAPRFHLEGTTLEFEELPPAEVADDLRGRGYTGPVVPESAYYFGSVQALEVDYGARELVAPRDRRRSAASAVESLVPGPTPIGHGGRPLPGGRPPLPVPTAGLAARSSP